MIRTELGFKMHRRHFLKTVGAATASFGLSSSLFAQVYPPKAGTVRDKLWVFCNPINADYDYVRRRTVMSLFESVVYMGVPNIIMTNQCPFAGQEEMYRKIGYKPWEPPFEQYMVPLSLLKRVAWSLIGASGKTKAWENKQILTMAQKTPNIVGVYLDDFFHDKPRTEMGGLTLDELHDIRMRVGVGLRCFLNGRS